VWAPQAILDNATCKLLASVGPINTLVQLKQLICSTWHRWEQHSTELFELLLSLNIPPLTLLANTISNKRTATASNYQPATSSKRPRMSTQSATRTVPLHTQPAISSPPHFPLHVSSSSLRLLVYPPTPLSQSRLSITSTQPYTPTSSTHLFAYPAPSVPSATKYPGPPHGIHNPPSSRTPAFNNTNTPFIERYPTHVIAPSQFASPAFNNNPYRQPSSGPFPYHMLPAHQSRMHFPSTPQFQTTQHPRPITFAPTYQSLPRFTPSDPSTSTQDFASQPYQHDTDIIPLEFTPIVPSHRIDTLHTDTGQAGGGHLDIRYS
jgi:hypothetical protein